MIDQLLLYDQSLITWLKDNVAPLAVGRASGVSVAPTAQILIATPQKAYAEVTTGLVVYNETLTLPRMSISRLSHEVDPMRFNCNRIRRLGWCDTPVQRRLRSSNYPTPINIMWQIDLWTMLVSEMNRWTQKLLMSFASGYIYLSVLIDDVWTTKKFAVFLDGGVQDNSNLDADRGDRSIRKTIMLRAETWLYDQDYESRGVVKRFQLENWNEDGSEMYDRWFLPPLEVLGTGDGSQVSFSGTLDRPPALEHTLVVQTLVGASIDVVWDDGAGNLVGDNAAGTINYTTGAWSLLYGNPPDVGEDITITYFTDLS